MNGVKQWLLPAFHPLYGRLLIAELRQLGFSDQQIFSGVSVGWNAFSSDLAFVNYDVVQQLIGRAVELTGKPWLGVEQTTFGEAFAHGVVGFGAMAADNLGAALQFASRFISLRERALGLDIHSVGEGQDIEITFVEHFELGPQREFLLGALVANFLRLLESLGGQYLAGARVQFPFPEPSWSAHYEQVLNARMEFGAKSAAIVVPVELLSTPCLSADPSSYQSAERECERLLLISNNGQDFACKVKAMLLSYDDNYPSQSEVAEHFHISTRTLMRRLKSSDTSFQQLLDEVRKELAEWYLINTNDAIESIAIQLGYADASNFSRTFRKWFDQTPGCYRKKMAQKTTAQQGWKT